MIVKENKLIVKGWHYKHNPNLLCVKDRFKITPKKKRALPETLFKYYPLNKFSVDAFINKYFYASCSLELNDPLDCMSSLISYDEVYEKKKAEFLSKGMEMPSLTEFKDKQNQLYGEFGVISLTENQDDLNMWANYASNHEGFAISFNTDYLKQIPRLAGPFPINYQKEWYPLVLEEENEAPLGFLYQTNIKSTKWKHENEWRFIKVKENMSIPRIRMDAKSIENRKSRYVNDCIKEITIGINFWIDILKSDTTDSNWKIVFEMKEGVNLYKYQLLNFLADQNEIQVSTFESKVNADFTLSKSKVKITKLESDLEFQIERI